MHPLLLLTIPATGARAPSLETGHPFGDGPRRGKGSGFRAPFEFYPTPPEAIRALLSAESFDGPIWEPACGDGAIARELSAAGYDVVASDIVDWGYGIPGKDFLGARYARARHIITNPPYGSGLADAFVDQALRLTAPTAGRVAMLMNIASLCHPSRHAWFLRHPPRTIYALDECICWPCGDPALATRRTLEHRYVWMLWDHGPVAATEFRWLSTAPFKDSPASHPAQPTTKGGNS